MQLLLHVPIEILHQGVRPADDGPANAQKAAQGSQNENLHLWKGVMIKALELSHFNNSLAVTCISTLERWFNALPVSQTAELYSDVVPKLSYFLAIEHREDGDQGTALTGNDLEERVQENFFF